MRQCICIVVFVVDQALANNIVPHTNKIISSTLLDEYHN